MTEVNQLWIDVRTQEENAARNVPGDRCLPFEEIKQLEVEGVDKDQPIYLYCRTGRRSGIAKQDLESVGFNNVHNAGSFEDMMDLRD